VSHHVLKGFRVIYCDESLIKLLEHQCFVIIIKNEINNLVM